MEQLWLDLGFCSVFAIIVSGAWFHMLKEAGKALDKIREEERESNGS